MALNIDSIFFDNSQGHEYHLKIDESVPKSHLGYINNKKIYYDSYVTIYMIINNKEEKIASISLTSYVKKRNRLPQTYIILIQWWTRIFIISLALHRIRSL